jgi:hypothetical protein
MAMVSRARVMGFERRNLPIARPDWSRNAAWCAREAGVNAGESPAGAIRRFSTEDRANCVAVRGGWGAG